VRYLQCLGYGGRIPRAVWQEAERLMQGYLNYPLERELNAPVFF
jgi:hypothetical protein